MKKQLSILAGSLVLASGANAALDLNGNALAVFSSAGQGAFFVDLGVTGDDLAAGTGFSVDISAATAALGGSIDSYAILAVASGANTYNYTEFLYVDVGGGLVTAGALGGTNLANINQTNEISNFLANANLGANGEGSLGDFDGFAVVNGLLTSGLSSLVLNAQTLGGAVAPTPIAITAPGGAQEGVYIDGTTFNATGVATVVPVPAAAWLFGSALVGLGVVRRK